MVSPHFMSKEHELTELFHFVLNHSSISKLSELIQSVLSTLQASAMSTDRFLKSLKSKDERLTFSFEFEEVKVREAGF